MHLDDFTAYFIISGKVSRLLNRKDWSYATYIYKLITQKEAYVGAVIGRLLINSAFQIQSYRNIEVRKVLWNIKFYGSLSLWSQVGFPTQHYPPSMFIIFPGYWLRLLWHLSGKQGTKDCIGAKNNWAICGVLLDRSDAIQVREGSYIQQLYDMSMYANTSF